VPELWRFGLKKNDSVDESCTNQVFHEQEIEPGDVILDSSGLNGLSANISGTPHAAINISCLRA